MSYGIKRFDMLPEATEINDNDLLIVSQKGVVKSFKVSVLNAILENSFSGSIEEAKELKIQLTNLKNEIGADANALSNVLKQAEENLNALIALGDATALAEKAESNRITCEKNTNDINDLTKRVANNTTQLKDLANLNLFINGGFSVWQRGTSFSTNGYTADRWMYDVEGDDKGKIVRHANGGVQIKLISNKRFWFMQRIELNQELKNIFSNSTVTLSFYVTTSAGVKISPYIRVWSPSRNANIFLKSYEAKATRQLIECQITLGDLSSDDWLGIDIFRIEEDNKFTVGDDLYIRFENAKFELGSKATPFVPRPYGEELALCQRYYYRWGNERARYRAVGINGNQLFFFVPLPTTLRIIPTINNTFSINTLSGAGVSDFTFAVNIVPMGMIVHATKSTHGMSDGQLMLSDDGSLDAEIY